MPLPKQQHGQSPPPPMKGVPRPVSLPDLKYGQSARIVGVHGESASSVRLQSLGVLPGREVIRENTAPLGDPVAYVLDGQKISLRLAEAGMVEIELL